MSVALMTSVCHTKETLSGTRVFFLLLLSVPNAILQVTSFMLLIRFLAFSLQPLLPSPFPTRVYIFSLGLGFVTLLAHFPYFLFSYFRLDVIQSRCFKRFSSRLFCLLLGFFFHTLTVDMDLTVGCGGFPFCDAFLPSLPTHGASRRTESTQRRALLKAALAKRPINNTFFSFLFKHNLICLSLINEPVHPLLMLALEEVDKATQPVQVR